MQTWDVYYPDAAATGLPFARCRVDPTAVLWLHAAPDRLAVTVRDADERVVAHAEPLQRAGDKFPMTRLECTGGSITRTDRWPTPTDLGDLVLLPGGEAGHLRAWWNAEDGSEWRWQVEFYNHR